MAKNSRASRRSTAEKNESGTADQRGQAPLALNPETRHGVVVVVVLTVSALLALSVFNLAGTVGHTINAGLGALFGWQRFMLWAYLAVIGVVLLFPERFHIAASQWTGFVLALLFSQGIMQLFLPVDQEFAEALQGSGGGYFGGLVSHPLRVGFGPVAAGIVMSAVFLIGLLMMFNTTLRSMSQQANIFQRFSLLIRRLIWRQRLAKLTANENPESEESEKPEFTSAELPDDQAEAAAEGDVPETEEPEYRPVRMKPAKREKRQIAIPLDLLDVSSSQPTSGNIEANKERIKKTLETFGIVVEMGEVNVGPTVTQFTLKPAEGVKLSQITSLGNDLALALAAHPIRIEAPIPGKSLVGIEVPNQAVALVNLRDILGSDAFKQRASDLTFSLGKDVSGKPWVANIDPLPHLLVAGATGSGKSVLINDLIVSLLYSNSPDDLKLILVDPKRVELSLYNNIPHLLTPVITDTTKTINALRWVVSEMDRRYGVLQNAGKRNIASYRKEVNDDMPYIVLIIDELADLMSVAANEVEGAIVRLAQMARAVGIHLVLATQRPSVDVITGLIKANVTARIAFSVASQIDSRTILDTAGAEKLLGKGDMLFVSAELSKPKRLQAAYVSEKEVERVTSYLKVRGKPDYMNEIVEKPAPQIGGSLEDLGDDELLNEAKQVILQADKASASLLQRRLRVGYARAARILDLLEEQGFIGPGEGAKPREILAKARLTDNVMPGSTADDLPALGSDDAEDAPMPDTPEDDNETEA